MAGSFYLNLDGNYVNGEKIAHFEEIFGGGGDVFDSLTNFINTYRNDIEILNILQCRSEAGTSYLGPDLNNLFLNCRNLTEVHIMENEYWSSNIRIDNMFYNCRNLTTVTMPSWTMNNVINMSSVFYNCYNLTSLDVSNWNINNVTNISYAFRHCDNLTSLNVSNWNTSNVRDMTGIFQYCYNLTSLDVSNWNISNVIYMNYAFTYCNNLTSLDVSNWNTNNIAKMVKIFSYCCNLTSLNLSNWNTSNVTDIQYIFYNCYNLKTIYINLNNWQLNINNTSIKSVNMFYNCFNLYGRKGTTYVSSKTDASYARIDGGPNLPGYFCGIYNAAVSNIPIKDAYFRGQKINKAILGRDLLDLKKKLITFTIDEIEYQAEEEMTFGKWVKSDYNSENFYIDETENYCLRPSDSLGYVFYVGSDGYWHNVNKDDIINSEENYFISK